MIISEVKLPIELMQSAQSLEDGLRILRVPTRKIPFAEWSPAPQAVQHFIMASMGISEKSFWRGKNSSTPTSVMWVPEKLDKCLGRLNSWR